MKKKIALIGNPNCGKTTLFNCLTGSTQYVGNWPGVTVEKKEGLLTVEGQSLLLVDLPGIYSLSPYSPEEVITRNYLIETQPDVIINIIDAANIERSLYLTTQILEAGLPTIVVVNRIDVIERNGDTLDLSVLEAHLKCRVVPCSALKKERCQDVCAALGEVLRSPNAAPFPMFNPSIEGALEEISKTLEGTVPTQQIRWYAVKFFERDARIGEGLSLDPAKETHIESTIVACEALLDDDSESLIANARYDFIMQFIALAVDRKNKSRDTVSDSIDKIVTNRVLALPIFALVMFLVYYLSISTLGAWGTDWVNDVLFGEIIPSAVGNFLVSMGTAEWLNSLILDGMIAGVGAVLGFLPQMLVLFFCLSILEDCGYMARIAFIMDRLFRRFGLSGKSFIPMLVGTGCSVPGIMASRTIESEPDRKMTVITTSFIPCSAKLPVIALIAGVFFPHSSWVAPSAYFVGVGSVLLSGLILKKTMAFSGAETPFIMELPAYHMPDPRGVFKQVSFRGREFAQKAGTIILLASVVIWFLGSFNVSLEMADMQHSILAGLGNLFAPLFAPLGWGDWRATVATFTGLIAKENVVGTFGVLYGASGAAGGGTEAWGSLRSSFSPLASYSFLVFNLLCAPCFAAIGAIHREMRSNRWTLLAVGFQTGLAYCVALIIYQLGTLFMGAPVSFWTLVALAVLGGMLYLLFKPNRYSHKGNDKKRKFKEVV